MRQIGRLHLISDRGLCPLERLPQVASAAARGGVDTVHLREKDLPGGLLLDVARRLRAVLGEKAALLVNERVDVALLGGAAGVQLGEDGLPVAAARGLLGEGLIGRSVHDAAGARLSVESGADFLVAGHIYQTGSKAGQPGRGLEFLRAVVAASAAPVIAIGGITPERVPEVLAAGAWGVAVLSGILAAADPEAAARRYRAAIDGAAERS